MIQLVISEPIMLRKNLSLVGVIVVLMLAKTIWSVSEETPETSRPWKRGPCVVGTRYRTKRCRAVSGIKNAKVKVFINTISSRL